MCKIHIIFTQLNRAHFSLLLIRHTMNLSFFFVVFSLLLMTSNFMEIFVLFHNSTMLTKITTKFLSFSFMCKYTTEKKSFESFKSFSFIVLESRSYSRISSLSLSHFCDKTNFLFLFFWRSENFSILLCVLRALRWDMWEK